MEDEGHEVLVIRVIPGVSSILDPSLGSLHEFELTLRLCKSRIEVSKEILLHQLVLLVLWQLTGELSPIFIIPEQFVLVCLPPVVEVSIDVCFYFWIELFELVVL